MVNEDDYKEQLKKLSPTGKAWTTENDSLWVKLLSAIAREFARIDARANQLIDETLPSTTIELLSDWERIAGLPDPCSGIGASIPIRRKDLLTKITARGGQTSRYFIDVASQLGYSITITEFKPFCAGSSRAGDPCQEEDWRFVWRINAPTTTITPFLAGQNSAGDALRVWGNERLECVIKKRKPAHTALLFGYS